METKKYKLSDLVTLKYGKNQKKVVDAHGKIPIYGTGGLMAYANEALYDRPSVLIGRKGTIDKVRYVEHPFWTVDTLFYTIVNETIVLPKYLYYLMSLIDLKQYNEGTTIPSLRTETLYRIELEIPSLQVQKEVLEYLTPIDAKITNNEAMNKNLLKQAVLLFSHQFGHMPRNGRLGDYCAVKSGYAFKSSWWCKSGIKVVKIGSINQDDLNLDNCSFVSENKYGAAKDFSVVGGDLLIAMTGATVGKFAMVPKSDETILVNQRVGKFFLGSRPVEKLPFIYCLLKQREISNEIINRAQGSAQPNISSSDIMSIPCVIPPTKELDAFNAQTVPLFETIICNQQENKRLAQLRDLLLPKLMSGVQKI